MATLWENIHSHAVCTRLNFSTTCQCTRFSFEVKPCTFNLPLQQKTKKRRQNDCNKRGKSCKRGNTQLLELFITMYTPNDSCSGVYLSQTHASITASQACTVTGYTTWLHGMYVWSGTICVSFGMFTCCFSRAYTEMEKANNARLYAVHVQPLHRGEAMLLKEQLN